MTEVQWVEQVANELSKESWFTSEHLSVKTALKLAYACEIASYGDSARTDTITFATDLAIVESIGGDRWKPRVVVEAKLGRVTTHDAITYSQKASTHRAVHPYLRYGIMLGDRKHYPLPGRLYRHGAQFDFMISFVKEEIAKKEMIVFVDLLRAEVSASRTLEKILYESRKPGRARYTLLHRQLKLQ